VRKQGWVSNKERLDRLFIGIERIPPSEPELRSHWVRYLVIRTSGFLETSVSYIYSQYAEEKAEPRVARFVAAQLDYPGNLKMDRLERLIRDFDDEWFNELQRTPEFDQIKAAVESVVSNRNRVAHGEDISTTIGQLKQYYEGVIRFLDLITAQCERETRPTRFRKKDTRKTNTR
jgi:hypothetical protein